MLRVGLVKTVFGEIQTLRVGLLKTVSGAHRIQLQAIRIDDKWLSHKALISYSSARSPSYLCKPDRVNCNAFQCRFGRLSLGNPCIHVKSRESMHSSPVMTRSLAFLYHPTFFFPLRPSYPPPPPSHTQPPVPTPASRPHVLLHQLSASLRGM